MTTTYDPHHPQYLDEADVRAEMTRVYDVCHGCRRCTSLCPAFPSLFEMIDRHDEPEAGKLTPAEQDRVVDECYQCTRCSITCPYTPPDHELQIDVPRLMLRTRAMRHAVGQVPVATRLATQVLARTGLVGTLGSAMAPVADKVTSSPGSLTRKLIAKATGVTAVRLLAPYAKERFSTWFKGRQRVHSAEVRGSVTVFPTCFVEYREPAIGRDLVRVYERNGIDCEMSEAGCCGAAWLQAGDIEHFTKLATKNVATLAAEIRRGTDVVVPQPTCGSVLRQHYPDYVEGPDARFVADHTYDAAEFLMKMHLSGEAGLDTEFPGRTVDQVTYHLPCHLRSPDGGLASRDLLRLTGARVKMVQQCSGLGGTWGRRADHDEISIPIGQELGSQVTRAGGDVVAGDCHLANTVIVEQTGLTPQHPIQVLARAYGIPTEP